MLNMSVMSLAKDQFNDAELTSFAIEIIKDLCSKPQVDSEEIEKFICDLAEEIEHDVSPSYSTDPSICSPYISNGSISTLDDDDELPQGVPTLPYASLSAPRIITRRQLTHDDSFNHSVPSLPASPVDFGHRTRATTFSKGKHSNSLSPKYTHSKPRFASRYRPPPKPQTPVARMHVQRSYSTTHNSMKSDITRHISPRYRKASTQSSSIPNFNDNVPMQTSKKPIQKTKRDRSKTTDVTNEFTYDSYDWRSNLMRSRSCSTKQIPSLITLNKQNAGYISRKRRTNSQQLNQSVLKHISF
eukprot:101743_1